MRKKLKSNRIILLVLLCMVPLWQAFGQDLQIQGKVTDSSTGEALPGVSVGVKGASQGTTTNMDGMYNITVIKGTVLVFSYVGYTTQEITIENGSPANVALVTDIEKLNEIVVIGYGTIKKSDATGSVNVVSSKDFNNGAITSPQDLIVGKVAGVVVTSQGGAPGSGFTIRIRGGSSINASNDPLIVIDGVPVDNDAIDGGTNPLASLNPNDIESFVILKDASATAIYGSRASNGVILVTTKKGSKTLKIAYNGTASFSAIPKELGVLSGDQFRSLMNQRYPGNNDVLSQLGTANTDWQHEIYQTAFTQDHDLSLSGTLKSTPYRASLGYTNQDGILKTSNMERTTMALNFNPNLLDDHLKININLKGAYSTNTFADNGAVYGAIAFDPTQPVMNGNTRWRGYTAITNLNTGINGDPNVNGTTNPVALLELKSDKAIVQRSIGNIQADYKFHFLPDLHANLNLGYDYSESNGRVRIPDSTSWNFDQVNGGGIKRDYSQSRKTQLLDFYLNYVKNLDALSSKIDVMGGYSWSHFYRSGNSKEMNFERTYSRSATEYATQYYLLSFFGRLNYTYKDKYLLTFTLRDDGTSRFSANNRWGLFPAAAFAWKINNESFLANSKVISDLKLRLGYGVTGQQNLSAAGLSDYPYLATYTTSTSTAQYQLGYDTNGNPVYYNTLRANGYDANIKWETTTTYNIGLDYGFLNNRITGTFDAYIRKTKDLLNQIPIAAGSNLTNQLLTNIGNMENKGVEFTIDAKIVTSKEWLWEMGYNIGYNVNKITKLTKTDDPSYLGVYTGGISGGVGGNIQIQSVGYPANSFFVLQQVYNQNGMPIEGLYVNRSGGSAPIAFDNLANRYHYKKAAPDATMGISSKLSYRNFDFSFSGRVEIGNYVYNNVASNLGTYLNLYLSNYVKNVISSANDTKFNSAQYYSDYYVENASFFRMDNIGIGYRFNNITQKKITIRLSAVVQNAFVITKYKGLDPEVDGGVDNNFYPRPRTFLLGLNLDF